MAKFVYVGESEKVEFRGIQFLKGQPVEVTDLQAIGKLTTNKMFTKVSEGSQKAEPPKPPQPTKPQSAKPQQAPKSDDDEDLV